jgi:hypothetical protein
VGASQWWYTVDYQRDVAAALRQLRQDVYERGEYYREPAGDEPDLQLTEEEFRARLDPGKDDDGFNDAIVEDWLERKHRPVPVDPDSLVAAQPHSGTHSIIDMINGASTPTGLRDRVPADHRRTARHVRDHHTNVKPGSGVDEERCQPTDALGRHLRDQLPRRSARPHPLLRILRRLTAMPPWPPHDG